LAVKQSTETIYRSFIASCHNNVIKLLYYGFFLAWGWSWTRAFWHCRTSSQSSTQGIYSSNSRGM